MPELSEVEALRCVCQRRLVGRTITAVRSAAGTHGGVFNARVFAAAKESMDEALLASSLMGRRVVAALRHGKILHLKLDGDTSVLVGLGMTGMLLVRGEAKPPYQQKVADDVAQWLGAGGAAVPLPKHTHLELDLEGLKVAYVDSRTFGSIRVRRNGTVSAVPPLSLLAPDAFLALPTSAVLLERLARSPGKTLKTALLDQEAAVSGVGNWIADEVCYQARLHPASLCGNLTVAHAAALRGALRSVLDTACAANAVPRRLDIPRPDGQPGGQEDGAQGRRRGRDELVPKVRVGTLHGGRARQAEAGEKNDDSDSGEQRFAERQKGKGQGRPLPGDAQDHGEAGAEEQVTTT